LKEFGFVLELGVKRHSVISKKGPRVSGITLVTAQLAATT
jgi:hypothetical protein